MSYIHNVYIYLQFHQLKHTPYHTVLPIRPFFSSDHSRFPRKVTKIYCEVFFTQKGTMPPKKMSLKQKEELLVVDLKAKEIILVPSSFGFFFALRFISVFLT